jgi:hypothetical protein
VSRREGPPRALGVTALGAAGFVLPAAVLAVAGGVSLFALPRLADDFQAKVVAGALALDFTLVFPALVSIPLVRARRVPWLVVFPAFAVGYAAAMATIPEQHQGSLALMRLLVVPAELLLVGYLVVVARRAYLAARGGDGDFATRFRSAARRALRSRVPADILATEVALLYYALRGRSSPPPARSFSVHREVGYLSVVIGLIMVLLVETVALHVLVGRWSTGGAWILTSLSSYAVLWLVGDYRAIAARPTRLTPTNLQLRVGVRWEAEIPIGQILEVAPLRSRRERPGRDTLVAALLGQPNLRLRLEEPIEVICMYGTLRRVREIWLRVDGAARLVKELRGSLDARGRDPLAG